MTKKQIEAYVLSMSKEMGELTIEQFAQIESTVQSRAFVNKKTVRCMDCNHTWESDTCSIDGTIECPVCHRKLKIEWTKRTCLDEMVFVNISQAWGDHWQVIRYFAVYNWVYRNYFPRRQAAEVMQIWIGENGKVVYIARDLCAYPSRQRNPFNMRSPMKVKHPEKNNNYYYSFDIRAIRCDTLKIYSVANALKYRGVRKNTNKRNGGFYLDVLFQLIQEPLAEVMYKNKQYDLLGTLYNKGFYARDSHFSQRVAALKIALRHKYFEKVEFVEKHKEYGFDDRPLYRDWVDNVENVIELGLDYRSPKYITPEKFQSMHSHLVKKITKKRNNERNQKEAGKILSDRHINDEYIEQRKAFFDLEFKNEDFTIRVLQSVEDFKNEGDALHHCVFANKYYNVANRPNCLILSARSGDDWFNSHKRIETIEVDLKDYIIIQSRGNLNNPSEFHNKIMALILHNMEEIKAINEKRIENNREKAKKIA